MTSIETAFYEQLADAMAAVGLPGTRKTAANPGYSWRAWHRLSGYDSHRPCDIYALSL